MKTITLLLALLMSALAGAQTQEGCFAPTQATSGPVAVTLWCQIVDYTNPGPLVSSWDTGLITLQRGFSAHTLHVQYDNWYAAMDSTVQLELVTRFSDVVFAPIFIQYNGNTWTADIPLGLIGASPGDRIRISHQSTIPHGCQLVDNCGLHMTLSFI